MKNYTKLLLLAIFIVLSSWAFYKHAITISIIQQDIKKDAYHGFNQRHNGLLANLQKGR